MKQFGNRQQVLKSEKNKLKQEWPYHVMLIIPVMLFILFNYFPMFGILMAFQDYKLGAPFLGAKTKWVGLRWFKQFFSNPMYLRYIRNTLLLNVLNLAITMPAAIMLALILNELRNKRIRRFASNVSLLPYFISTVIIVGIMKNFLQVEGGIVNNIRMDLGLEPYNFFGDAKWFRFLYIISGLWSSTGFSAVIYTAAIAGINPELYEAAAIDGSTRFKNMFYITIPSILPTIIILLILNIGSMLAIGYEKIILMYSPATYETADVLATYTYRMGILKGNTSFATAVDLFNGICNVILLLISNSIAKRRTGTSLF